MTDLIKERPILFSAPMVRALLDGTKTQTRRPIKGIDPERLGETMSRAQWSRIRREIPDSFGPRYFCSYGQPGDRLWVRETFMDLQGTGVEHRDQTGRRQRYAYAADNRPGSYGDEARKDFGLKWKPSIHMPRAASRILLEVVSVRVDRLQEINATDAKAEGVAPQAVRQINLFGASAAERATIYRDAAIAPFRELWEQINGAGSWANNPWVWVVEFKRVKEFS